MAVFQVRDIGDLDQGGAQGGTQEVILDIF